MNNKEILIIDDDSKNIFALCAVLKAKNYHCVSASSAAAGFKILQENDHIGTILMDMMMPEMDGYEAISKMRNDPKLQQIPIIAVTAQAMSGDREKCLEAGATDYISKPINVDQLVQILNKVLK